MARDAPAGVAAAAAASVNTPNAGAASRVEVCLPCAALTLCFVKILLIPLCMRPVRATTSDIGT
eukprot:5804565-Prymnesium_polylepis.1